MKTYRSRISMGLVLSIALICFIPFTVTIFVQGEPFMGIMIPLAIFAFILLAMFGIKYVIDGETLKIYYFWGIHTDIDIKTIRKMEPSHCLLSSPAASLNRLAIYYNRYDYVYISPKNQDDFIKQITTINPDIQL